MTDKNFKERFCKARRAVIARDYGHLNKEQLEAVLSVNGALLVLAGAGSGKTTVLINRIANLVKYGEGSDSDEVPDWVSADDLDILEQLVIEPHAELTPRAYDLCVLNPVPPWQVIAITFTNKAAGEIKARLERMFGVAARDIWAMTFHSACVRILRRYIDKLGYDRSFTIYDTADTVSLMKRIMKELDVDDKVLSAKTVLSYISTAKGEMIFADDFMYDAKKKADSRINKIAEGYIQYENRLRSANALDFDDLILLTVKLLKEHADVREYYQRQFRYVLVDEYQDTNNLQYMLAGALAGGYDNICVVGDDDQSIYKFRGATIENILSFEARYKNARVIRLEQNFRSTGHILQAANSVIGNNKGRKGKTLWTENEDGEKLVLESTSDERDEARYVASTIISNVSGGAKWSDHAVLYRMNAQSNQLETAFRHSGIPFKIVGGTGFYERAEIKDMLAYLCLINNPNDDLRLLRVINNPPRGIGQRTVERLREIARINSVSLIEAIELTRDYEETVKAYPKLKSFSNMIMKLNRMKDTHPLEVCYDELVEDSRYLAVLSEKLTDENLTRIENVRELKTNIVNYTRENENGTLFEFLNEIALYTDLDSYDGEGDCVVMMTMHSAKGLEFDNVFIVGAEEGIFPGIRAIGEPDQMEEERRLCYVAMTRARRRLVITNARQRTLFGKTTAGRVSRFADEIGDDDIERTNAYDYSAGDFYGNEFEDSFEPHFRHDPRSSSYGVSQKPQRTSYERRSAPLQNSAALEISAGDAVIHKAFGRGTVLSVKPGGSDALLEIEFEVGVKRLMLKTASAYMEKESIDLG